MVCHPSGGVGANGDQDECSFNACSAMCEAGFDGVKCNFFTHDGNGECVLFEQCGFLETFPSRTTYVLAGGGGGSGSGSWGGG